MNFIPNRFRGKRALVTGASKGIGRAVALRFAQEGARVALISRTRKDLDEVAAAIAAGSPPGGGGGEAPASERVRVFPADVSREEQLAPAIDAAAEAWGGLDIIISNAGIELPFQDSRVDQLEFSVWNKIVQTNLSGQFLTCKHGIRHLLKGGGGAVVMVGSPCGGKGFCFYEHAYTASKGGILALMQVVALDYIRDNIRVNACIPGFIDTPMNVP